MVVELLADRHPFDVLPSGRALRLGAGSSSGESADRRTGQPLPPHAHHPGRSFLPFASPNNTDQNGILLDKPIGTCFLIEPRIDVCAIVTQRFQVVVTPGSGLGSQRTFPISTQAVRADCGFGMAYSLMEGGIEVIRVNLGTLP